MKLPKIPLAQMVIQLCESKDVQHIVISPGSRNAPLTIGFTNHPYFKSYSIVDERCAAFFALGIAQQTKKPVALVCTSGSALLNYYPAITEAYYSDIPLVVISADRPQHLIGIGDGQTINQENVFKNHILYMANLKYNEDDFLVKNNNEIEINSALNFAIINNGPVHINVPLNEPLYDMINEFSTETKSIPIPEKINEKEDLSEYRNIWNSSDRKLILVGVNTPNILAQEYIEKLANDDSILVFTETTSNLHHNSFFSSIDKIIAPLSEEEFLKLQPDILLTFGGLIVSKKIKAFLRTYQPKHHWHIDEKRANNTFFCLEKHFKMTVNTFFKELQIKNEMISDYKPFWNKIKTIRNEKHKTYLNEIPFCDLKAFDLLLDSLPSYSNLQLSNSSTIRYMQLFDVNKTLSVYCNRGTSGIDGSTSTAIGAAIMSKNQTILITGDLSFFYDSNALWNNHIPKNFRIILMNNSGGGIFRILPGHKNTENFDTYFETTHKLTAKQLCEMYNFGYKTAFNEKDLKNVLVDFYSESDQPKLLEVFTPRTINDDILLKYFSILK
ncbi:2-succinyl-5-enolpyruvyl-6-hydroxy-3-cyclohexene-1-carboxylic-acid synthase [Flavobacteriaceae bacterium AU392]|nr:2-succinyl-5-enolpyruvyl-6-hydroxy-3-cyclohexene-1-carboxylic-acid synthase [Flavobacteriaceae bacterium]RKM85426.1 2-succinyl-5-enolpyruvyl-6-hydroxy-3-cyclohexene-1-carboxylic-acid synthase [Flavobacteriaceae bacterium AU392]